MADMKYCSCSLPAPGCRCPSHWSSYLIDYVCNEYAFIKLSYYHHSQIILPLVFQQSTELLCWLNFKLFKICRRKIIEEPKLNSKRSLFFVCSAYNIAFKLDTFSNLSLSKRKKIKHLVSFKCKTESFISK